MSGNNLPFSVPEYGFKVNLNHKYPEKWKQKNSTSLKQLWDLLPLIIRYLIYYFKNLWHGRIVIMDFLRMQTGKQIYGVPIGGIGGGTIGRGYKGEFCRFQLKPGVYEYNSIDADQFIVTIKDDSGDTLFQSLLSTYNRKKEKALSSWQSLLDGSRCRYTALFPRAWTEYDLSEYGIKLTCRQISPVIPHNYKDSSIPCAVFVWTVENTCSQQRTVTISFTFKNGTGTKLDKIARCSTKSFSYLESSGVILYNQIDRMACAYAIATKVREDVIISKCLAFDPTHNGEAPWMQLYQNGQFDKLKKTKSEQVYSELACGIAMQTVVKANSNKELETCLVWDMPTVSFHDGCKKLYRYYTKHFGQENATLKMVDYALKNYKDWDRAIYEWQRPVLEDEKLPDWYKAALFNESYYISDGGTTWFTLDEEEAERLSVNDPRQKYGRFGYLEGHEYRMYNTYDVHYYASYALAMNWPHLQQSLQYDLRDYVFVELPQNVKMLYDGAVCERKVKNSVPHDVGDPNENPFVLINSYPIHDVSRWRDLNCKFVLQTLRDYCVWEKLDSLNRKQYLDDMYDACHTVMLTTLKFDVDNDGLIENSGSPDQTFDTWVMSGSSTYCGGLWLGALFAMTVMAKELRKNSEVERYEMLLKKGTEAFRTKLWNGKFYNFDCSKNASTIMADQLSGHWYLRSCGYKYEVFPEENVRTALKTVYDNNVLSYCGGNMGAVNGFKEGDVDSTATQSAEVWTGVTYALAACMLQENLSTQAWKTAEGMHQTLVNRMGMIFETPEAITAKKSYRSIGYMRPLSIWSMQLAWQQKYAK